MKAPSLIRLESQSVRGVDDGERTRGEGREALERGERKLWAEQRERLGRTRNET